MMQHKLVRQVCHSLLEKLDFNVLQNKNAFPIIESQKVNEMYALMIILYFQKTLCHFRKYKAVAQVTKISILPPYNEYVLKAAVALIGPISVSINASPRTFQFYS